MVPTSQTHEGGCSCGHVRYTMTSSPLIVHACHCRWCQRQSGGAFAINALIESNRVDVLQGDVEEIVTPSPSGEGQIIVRCPTCRVAVWSHYLTMGDDINFIRVGTLDDPDSMPPDVHIFTSTKQPWFALPENDYAVETYYETDETWSEESLERRAKFLAAREVQA